MDKLFSFQPVKRDQLIRLRVTSAERELILQKAKDCGLSASDYIRLTSMSKAVRTRTAAEIICQLVELNFQLKKHHSVDIGGAEQVLEKIAILIERVPSQLEDFLQNSP